MKDKIEQYIKYITAVKRSTKNTVASYTRDLNAMADFFIQNGIDDVAKVTYTNVNAYILYLEKNGKSVSTIRRNISAMKTFFHYMLARGYIESEPTELITPPKAQKRRVGVNSVSAIERLLKQPKGDTPIGLRDKAMFELLYATGMRVSEITEVRLTDINMNLEYVVCRNNKQERCVPFGKKAKNAINKYLEKSREELKSDDNSDYLFLNCNGGKLSRQGFWKILKDYAKKADIREEITPHTLRHSFGAYMIANGTDLKSVQELMGHIDMASTEVYLKRIR